MAVSLGACARNHGAASAHSLPPREIEPVAGRELPGSARDTIRPIAQADSRDAGVVDTAHAHTKTDTASKEPDASSNLGLPEDGGGIKLLDAKPVERLSGDH